MRFDFYDLLTTVGAAWVVSPIPLAILYGCAKSKGKKQEKLLQRLSAEGKLTDLDFRASGLKPPFHDPNYNSMPAPAESQAYESMMAQNDTLPPTVIPEQLMVPPMSECTSAAAEIKEREMKKTQPEIPEKPISSPVVPERKLPDLSAASDLFPQSSKMQEPPKQLNISAISAMLAVGVVLVVVAGLLFVRSQWDSLANGGKLTILGAGSLLFFGVSALAHRVWKLERTGMAFYTIGAAFLPLSIWAAGYFELLGNGLSGASNKWTITLAFAAFTVTALAAVPIYQQIGWGIATLCGFSATYLCFTYALTEVLTDDRAPVLLCAGLYALLLTFSANLLKDKLPKPIGKAIVPFSLGFAIFACILQFTEIYASKGMIAAAAALVCAACWFAPAAAEKLENWAVSPFGVMSFYGFAKMFYPLTNREMADYLALHETGWLQLTAIVCILVTMLLCGTKSVPEQIQKGFQVLTYVFGGAALLMFLSDNDAGLILMGAMLVLMIVLMIVSVRKATWKWQIPQTAAAVTALCICIDLCSVLQMKSLTGMNDIEAGMTCACALTAVSLGFLLVKRLHSVTGGFLLPAGIVGFCTMVTDWGEKLTWMQYTATAIVTAVAVYLWFAALHRDEIKPIRFLYAVGLPMVTFAAMNMWQTLVPENTEPLYVIAAWSAVSFAAAAGAYYTARKEFHIVRRVVFAVMVLPPLVAASIAGNLGKGGMIVVDQLLCAAGCFWIYRLFSNRGFNKYAMAGCAVCVFLLTAAAGFCGGKLLYDCFEFPMHSFPLLMIAGIVQALLSVLAFLIRKRMVFFTGCDALASVMSAASVIYAFLLANRLLLIDGESWHMMLFLYTLGFCVLSWILTKPESFITVIINCAALFMGIEAARRHAANFDAMHVAAVICTAGIMTLLMPYLGAVLREGAANPKETRRGWVLTGFGGIFPLWLVIVSTGAGGNYYSNEEARWMLFFMLIFLAGYIVHFRFVSKDDRMKRMIGAVAGGVMTAALWLQPAINIEGTYWENKLHLIPLIAFGVWIRYLYGAETGSKFLFEIGIYSMLRLGFSAIGTESMADLLTVIAAAAGIFVISFIFKQKKWFVLGGVSLIVLSGYLQIRVMHGIVWWVYLLIIGVILIAVAGVNEMMKQHGESLKEKAGRFWQDWTW